MKRNLLFILTLLLAIQVSGQLNSKSPCHDLSGSFSIAQMRVGQTMVSTFPEGSEIYFEASEKKITAYIGCNRMAGIYSCSKNILSIDIQTSTRMACPGNIEAQFKQNLGVVNKFKWVHQKVYCYRGKKLLLVLLHSTKQKNELSIEGNYMLDSIWSGKILFHADFSKSYCKIKTNKISCSVGCNSISGDIKAYQGKIEPLKLMMTEMYCAAIDALEKQFTHHLESSNRYEVDSTYVRFFNNQQLLMVFKRKDE
ncbi:MAG: META domain-containing protein [Bacteroidetes bacterium]|nr:META domain-containing protein [Bacteroidota bacterium]